MNLCLKSQKHMMLNNNLFNSERKYKNHNSKSRKINNTLNRNKNRGKDKDKEKDKERSRNNLRIIIHCMEIVYPK